jgi:methyl-accepting chemotaxis protein
MKLNIRNKLILFAVLAIVVPLGLSALIILQQLSSFTNERSTERIKSDARVAKSIFDKRRENVQSAAQSVAQSIAANRGAAAAPQPPAAGQEPAPSAPARGMQDALKNAQAASSVSFVAYLDPRGKVVAQHNGAGVGDGMYFANNVIVKDVINQAQTRTPEARSGVVVEEQAAVDAINLTDRAKVGDVGKGLFLEAAAPVMSGDSLQGVVLLGQLVNNDVDVSESAPQKSIVNEIKETLYRDMREEGSVIIAMTDGGSNTIVTTNLPAGSQGGVVVGRRVADAGGTFEAPSYNEERFPSGDYVTSFVPIESVSTAGASTIGRIGVAIKEDWFTSIVRRVQWTILVVTIVALLMAIAGAVYAAQRLTRPIEELTEAANRISLGELDVPIAVQSDDEIGTLGESLDRMRISLKQAIERLRKR